MQISKTQKVEVFIFYIFSKESFGSLIFFFCPYISIIVTMRLLRLIMIVKTHNFCNQNNETITSVLAVSWKMVIVDFFLTSVHVYTRERQLVEV